MIIFKKQRVEIQQTIQKAKIEIWNKFIFTINVKASLKSAWTNIQKLQGRKQFTSLDVGGDTVKEPIQIANSFADYFVSISSDCNYSQQIQFLNIKKIKNRNRQN